MLAYADAVDALEPGMVMVEVALEMALGAVALEMVTVALEMALGVVVMALVLELGEAPEMV